MVETLLDFLFAGGGLVLLLVAGDFLVRGAVNLSLRLGISALVVSLTVVSLGTSAPELVISVDAVLTGSPGIALGNVVGSNIANVLLVLGLPALVAGLSCSQTDTKRSCLVMIGATVIFIAACMTGPLTRIHGVLFLGLLSLILLDQIRVAKKQRGKSREAPEGADPSLSRRQITFFLVAGIVGLPIGAELFVDSAVNIATRYEVSEMVIGLTLVAIGTSLPELATTVAAAIRRQADVALGNVIGSNIFNMFAIIGVASLFGEIPVDESGLWINLIVMLLASAALAIFVLNRKDISKPMGATFVIGYIAYVVTILS